MTANNASVIEEEVYENTNELNNSDTRKQDTANDYLEILDSNYYNLPDKANSYENPGLQS